VILPDLNLLIYAYNLGAPDHDGYLSSYALITEGKTAEVTVWWKIED
jgi:hypothetical protein